MRWHWLLFGLAACGGKAVIDPVGGTGGSGSTSGTSTSTTTAVSVSVATSTGTGPVTCEGLEPAYANTLQDAKQCEPDLDIDQCLAAIEDALPCPCPTSYNPENYEAAEALDDLRAQWDALGCGQLVDCPAIPCPTPQGVGCSQDGFCTDFGAD